MATFESLQGNGQQVSLDNFSLPEEGAPVVNVPSVKNASAHVAILNDNPDSVLSTYKEVASQLSMKGESPTGDSIENKVAEDTLRANQRNLVPFLTDPNISDDQKRTAANNILDRTNAMYSNQAMVGTKAAEAGSAGETVEAESSRVNVGAIIQNVNAVRQEQQNMYNAAMTANDPNGLEAVKGFVETLLPFSESTQVAAIKKELDKSGNLRAIQDTVLSGEAKQDMIDSMRRLPPDQRLVATRHLLDAVENNNGAIYLPDKNKMQSANILNQIVNGDYEDWERWVDNAVGILDTTMIGGAVARFGRGLVSGLRGTEAATDTARTVSAAEEVTEQARPSLLTQQADETTPENLEITQRRMQDKISRKEGNLPDDISVEAAERSTVTPPKTYRQPDGTLKVNKQAQKRYEKELAKQERALRIEARRNMQRSMVRNQTQPATVSQVLKDTNPQKARNSYELAAADDTGEAAQALYGTSRTEAVANDNLAEISTVDGSVKHKIHEPNANYENINTPDQDTIDFVDNVGAIYYTNEEKRLARARVANDFESALGLTHRGQMMSVEDTPSGMNIRAMYAPKEGGFANAEDALNQTKFALRDFGVTDQDLTLMRREGADYVPTTLEEARRTGSTDHQVMINHSYSIGADTVHDWTNLDVKMNIFDRIPSLAGLSNGSFNRHVVDPASSLHPTIVRGASTQIDKASGLEKRLRDLSNEFAEPYSTASKERQQLMEQVMKEANYKSKWPTDGQLRTQGFSDGEIKTLGKWKEFWDNMYWLENKDMVRTLRNRNYHVLEDAVTDTRIFARPISRNQLSGGQKIYDQSTGGVRYLNSDEVSELYSRGGTIAEMKSPMRVGDDSVEMVASENKAGEAYFRRLTDNDKVLNYREGYYTVRYDSPHFIVKREKDAKGNVLFERAVATAGDAQEADHMVKRLAATDGGDYYRRGDVTKERYASDDYWDMAQAGGRTAQRVRGKRLEDASGGINDKGIDHAYVEDPITSMQKSAVSLATRTSMRDYMEATKARFMDQYAELLPKGKFGQPVFPSSIEQIRKPGRQYDGDIADARTTWEYIKFLEDGYINSVDEVAKQSLKALALASSRIKGPVGKYAEKGLNWASDQRSPTNIAKTIAFDLYLALNPLRQLVVQGHQAVQLMAIEPAYFLKGLGQDTTVLMALRMGAPEAAIKQLAKLSSRSEEELKQMHKFLGDSGLMESVDKHNLIRGSLTELVENRKRLSKWNVPGRAYTFAVDKGRKFGFDIGEEANMMTAWLTFYNRAKKAGKEMNKETLDNISADARNYTYNMNRAGDMPYNSNIGAIVAQFMQVPHKAFMQVLGNRQLSKVERLRIGTFNALMYGLPASMIYDHFSSVLPDDPEMKQILANGLEGTILNKALELTFDEDSNIDFSGLAASDLTGIYEFITGLITTDVGTLVSESPSIQAMGRIGEVAKTASRYFNITQDYSQNPTTFLEVVKSTASLSSGMSNTFKAKMALDHAKKFNSSGSVSDMQATTPEAIAQIWGFRTIDEAMSFNLSNEMYEKSTKFETDVKEWYKQIRSHLSRDGIQSEEADFVAAVSGEAQRAFKNSPRAMEVIRQQIRFDVQNGDDWLFRQVLDNADIMSHQESMDIINRMPNLDEDKRASLKETMDIIQSYKDEE